MLSKVHYAWQALDVREEVERMFSSRVKLALLAVASIVGAAFVGGLPWGP
jgi:hypothetical protein